jgi:hypothetical protein
MEKEMTQKDNVKPLSFGFIELALRDGRVEVVNTNDIKSIQTRAEGGASIRLMNDHVLLVSCPIQDVLDALRVADGGLHATAG